MSKQKFGLCVCLYDLLCVERNVKSLLTQSLSVLVGEIFTSKSRISTKFCYLVLRGLVNMYLLDQVT